MIAPIATFDFPCTVVTTPAVAPNVGPGNKEDCCVKDGDADEEDEGRTEDCCFEPEDGGNDEGEDNGEEDDGGMYCRIKREPMKILPWMGAITRVCWPVGERGSD